MAAEPPRRAPLRPRPRPEPARPGGPPRPRRATPVTRAPSPPRPGARRVAERADASRIPPSVVTGALLVAFALCAVLFVRGLGGSGEDEVVAPPAAENHPPEIQSLELVLSTSGVAARAQGRDADGDRFRFHYRWTVGGRPQRARGALLPRAYVPAGASVEVEATPVDSRGASGRPMRSTISVEPARP